MRRIGKALRGLGMRQGGMGMVKKPTLFLAGEAGSEEFAFSGANRRFPRLGDTESEPETQSRAGDGTHTTIIELDGQVLAKYVEKTADRRLRTVTRLRAS